MLHLHRCDRTDVLVGALAALLRTPPEDPFTPEVIAVPSRGVERWIAQSLSVVLGAGHGRGDGVCANVEFPSPSRLVRDVAATCCGIAPDEDPWAEPRLVWTVLAVMDDCGQEPWCAALGRHLSGERGERRRVAVAQRLARLFGSYGAQRPSLVRDWAAGGYTDGAGTPLADDLRWQAEFWRRLRERIAVASPAERLGAVRDRLALEPQAVSLPGRLSVIGATRLAADEVQVLAALAEHRDVHLWLPHPSPVLWERIAATGSAAGRRRADPTALLARHPLLASLARDARELQLALAAEPRDTDEALPTGGRPAAADHSADRTADGSTATPGTRATLLAALQADLRADRDPDGTVVVADGDVSIQVHACHGAPRQVEVLREVVLGALADDPTLEPRHIVVMCPDIDAYAPLVTAAFGGPGHGGTGRHPGHAIRIRLADRSLRRTNPVLSVLDRLLTLAQSRLTASEVLDLAAMPPVRRRFDFDDDDLSRVRDWVRGSGVRWGLDAAARAPYGLATVRAHTWEWGLDRLLLGVAMDADGLPLVGGTLPVDEVASTAAGLAGRFAEFIDRIARAGANLTRTHPARAWCDILVATLEDLAAPAPEEPWQLENACDQIADALQDGGDTDLDPAGVRALLEDRLRGRPTRANFRTGDLTFATLVPMRSVPHRMICVLGLDDGAFPRHPLPDGDDVLARDPLTGERDLAAEDRQLLLDAVLAARERLVLLYSGADPRTGATRPPAVPLGELLDVLDATGRRADRSALREHLVVHHPLQPFDPRNFTDPFPISFDGSAAAAARAMVAPHPEPARTPDQVPVPLPGTVLLDDLVRFCEHPVRTYVRERLGLAPDQDDPWSDDLPIDVDPLGRWAVGDWVLRQRMLGLPLDRVLVAARDRPELPLGPGGDLALVEIVAGVEAVTAAAEPFLAPGQRGTGPPRAVPVSVELACGTRLAGAVPGVRGSTVVRLIYSRLGPKHRIRAFVHLLALCAGAGEEPGDDGWRSVVVAHTQTKDGPGAEVLQFPALDAGTAARALDGLVRLYAEGRSRPLPLPLKTSYAYAEQRLAGRETVGLAYAARQWRDGRGSEVVGEFDDVFHVRVWGPDAPFEVLTAEAAAGDPPHRFGQLALWLWTPILRAGRS